MLLTLSVSFYDFMSDFFYDSTVTVAVLTSDMHLNGLFITKVNQGVAS